MQPLKVALPLGIGDAHWSCTKLRALSEFHDGRPIHAYINRSPNHLSVGFLKLVPFVTKAYESPDAPYDVTRELPPNHQDPRWATLEGSQGWAGFDYVCVANGHLETGNRLETFWPELKTDFTYQLNIPKETQAKMLPMAERVLVYMSGIGPNYGFHRDTWNVKHWALVVDQLNKHGVIPVLVGASTTDDLGYLERFKQFVGNEKLEYEDIVGETSLPEYCEIIRTARCWVGLNSGGGIVAGMLKTPTVMLWSDSAWPIPGVTSLHLPLNTAMQTSWLSNEQLASYRTLSFGSPHLTPENLVQKIVEVAR